MASARLSLKINQGSIITLLHKKRNNKKKYFSGPLCTPSSGGRGQPVLPNRARGRRFEERPPPRGCCCAGADGLCSAPCVSRRLPSFPREVLSFLPETAHFRSWTLLARCTCRENGEQPGPRPLPSPTSPDDEGENRSGRVFTGDPAQKVGGGAAGVPGGLRCRPAPRYPVIKPSQLLPKRRFPGSGRSRSGQRLSFRFFLINLFLFPRGKPTPFILVRLTLL